MSALKMVFLMFGLVSSIFAVQADNQSAEIIRERLSIPEVKEVQAFDNLLGSELDSFTKIVQDILNQGAEDAVKKTGLADLLDRTFGRFQRKADEGIRKIEVEQKTALQQSQNISQGVHDLTKELVGLKDDLIGQLKNVTQTYGNLTKQTP